MKEKIVISLNEKEQVELEQIIIDEDEKQALEFLKEVIKKKVDKADVQGCKPVFEWQDKEPQIWADLNKKNESKK